MLTFPPNFFLLFQSTVLFIGLSFAHFVYDVSLAIFLLTSQSQLLTFSHTEALFGVVVYYCSCFYAVTIGALLDNSFMFQGSHRLNFSHTPLQLGAYVDSVFSIC